MLISMILFCIAPHAHAYRMPAYRIAEADWPRPAEMVNAAYQANIEAIDAHVSILRLENHRRCHTCRLSARERDLYGAYIALKVPHEFWGYVAGLKRDLVSIADGRAAEREADLMAKKIVQKIYDLSNEYGIAGSALIHNALVNMGVKEKGFCYHYIDALWTMLRRERWQHFDIYWGAAYEDTFRENNGLVLTAKGKPFDTGIVIDPWRTASRPYWHAVKGDRFPWVEVKDVDRTYDLSK